MVEYTYWTQKVYDQELARNIWLYWFACSPILL